MDPVIAAAARALAAGDPLGALDRVALREDGHALALRGIAMAQLGDFARARALLGRAARAFGARQAVARARCIVAQAEIALVSRDLTARELASDGGALDAARAVLERAGDLTNAAHARHLDIRRLLLIGRLDKAERLLEAFDPAPLPPASLAAHELAVAGLAMRRLRTAAARSALSRARDAVRRAGIAALVTEVEALAIALEAPAARRIERGQERPLRLEEVEALLASGTLVVDACRHAVRRGASAVSLATRPVLFALARSLAHAWPGGSPRQELLTQVFGARHADESHRARLRVEIGRLRAALRPLGGIEATADGFVLRPRGSGGVVVLAPPVEERHGALLALLADGEAWSSSALCLALGASQRSVQRALEVLAADGKAEAVGAGRSRRWVSPPAAGFTTTLLLPGALPGG